MTKRRIFRIPLALALGLLAVLGVSLLLGPGRDAHAQASTRYVSSLSGQDAGDCTSPLAPCRSIQYAVDQSTTGDELRIATYEVNAFPPLTATTRYTGSGANVVALSSDLLLRGGYVYLPATGMWMPGYVPAPVDGEGTRRVLHASGVTVTLERLAFTNGSATLGGNVYAEDADVTFRATPVTSGTATYGGGLYLRNCRTDFDAGELDWSSLLELGLLPVQNNRADYGAGIYVDGGTPLLSGLFVSANSATHDGGGLYLDGGQPIVAGGLVLENQAGNRGGGFFLQDSPARIAGTYVYSNTAADGGGFYLDGPVGLSPDTIPIIANSYVRYNSAPGGSRGGGFYLRQSIAGLANNVVADNAAADGAAMYLWASSPQVFHNTIAHNTGNSGIHATHRPGQAWPPIPPIPSWPAFTNTILVSHTVGVYVDSTGLPFPLQNRVTLHGTLWHANGSDAAGPGEVVRSDDVSGHPRFTCTGDPPGCLNPHHILTGSAALDAGVPLATLLPGADLQVDIDLQLRPSGDGYDIGADEVVSESYSVWLYPPLSAQAVGPGEVATHTHSLMNTGLQTDTYTLTHHSGTGWATLLATSPVTLAAQTSITVRVEVRVPPEATQSMSDTTILTAASPHAQANALDLTQVVTGTLSDLAVAKWAEVEGVAPGEGVRFTLAVTRTGALTGTLLLTDTVVPTAGLAAWSVPAGCAGVTTTGRITCAWALPAGSPFTHTFDVVITTTGSYTGLLVNTAQVGAGRPVLEEDYTNNVAQVTILVTDGPLPTIYPLYLPLVMRSEM